MSPQRDSYTTPFLSQGSVYHDKRNWVHVLESEVGKQNQHISNSLGTTSQLKQAQRISDGLRRVQLVCKPTTKLPKQLKKSGLLLLPAAVPKEKEFSDIITMFFVRFQCFSI